MRRKGVIFAALLVACIAGSAVAIAAGVRSQEPRVATSDAARKALSAAQAVRRPVVVFRSLEPEGQVAVSALGAPSKPAFQPLSCDRVHFAAGRGICLARSTGLNAALRAKLFDAGLRVRQELSLEGVPSRARVSPDGRYGTVTTFVSGHSYASAGGFSTATTIIDMARGESIANLEDFTVTRGGRLVTAVDANYWGVTFARDSDRFYATLATGGETYLIEGSVSRRVARVIHSNVECPSLSPDGTRVAYKRRTGSKPTTPWRLAVLDLTTKRETMLGELRSIDDQAEWLDDDRVLYGLDDQVWVVPADGSGKPERFLQAAGSPAVVRW
jgi:dipeptidyl aminopeptidase/acylaminoacyl peptidase